MKNNVIGKENDILTVLFWTDVLLLAILLFYSTKLMALITVGINLVFIGAFFVIQRYGELFGALAQSYRIMGKLNNVMGSLNG